jgi:hypothetical protein
MSETTESSLIPASSSSFWIRWVSRERSSISFVRYRVRSRSSACTGGGTKLGRNSPHSHSCANHSESATSVLRPGMFFTACALTSSNSHPPTASRTCQTGFQYTPVASIATWVTPSATSHSRSCRSESVNVANRRTVEARPPFEFGVRTHAITVFLCTSNPAHRETITSTAAPPCGRVLLTGPPQEPGDDRI